MAQLRAITVTAPSSFLPAGTIARVSSSISGVYPGLERLEVCALPSPNNTFGQLFAVRHIYDVPPLYSQYTRRIAHKNEVETLFFVMNISPYGVLEVSKQRTWTIGLPVYRYLDAWERAPGHEQLAYLSVPLFNPSMLRVCGDY